jgi:rhodanese-related sulfurtransferase
VDNRPFNFESKMPPSAFLASFFAIPDNPDFKAAMDIQSFLNNYWPLLALAAWFGYKWWNSRRVVGRLPSLKAKGALLVDVRSPDEFGVANAPGTVNIPLGDIGNRLAEIPKTAPVVLCCASGTRSGMAKMVLKKNGYTDVHNVGAWTKLL